MNTFFSQFKKGAEELRLTHEERAAMMLRIREAMRARPSARSAYAGGPAPSPFFFFFAHHIAVPTLVLVLAVGAGTTYAAEGALPGDFLYRVKIGLNEPVRSALAFSDVRKAAVHAEFAERRLEEAEVLAARGTLALEVKSALEDSFEEHAFQVAAYLKPVAEEEVPVLAASKAEDGAEAGATMALMAAPESGVAIRAESAALSEARSDTRKSATSATTTEFRRPIGDVRELLRRIRAEGAERVDEPRAQELSRDADTLRALLKEREHSSEEEKPRPGNREENSAPEEE